MLLGETYDGARACVIRILQKLAQDGDPRRVLVQQAPQSFCQRLCDVEALCHLAAVSGERDRGEG